MCNLYSVTTDQEAIRRLFRVQRDLTGNLPPGATERRAGGRVIPGRSAAALTAMLLAGAVSPRAAMDCASAFTARNALAQEETAILQAEAGGARLTPGQRSRLDKIRKLRRQLLVCG